MRISLFISVFTFLALTGWAQTPKTVRVEDPKAKEVFEKVRDRYEAYKTLTVNFSIEIQIPQNPPINQTGTLLQQGKKYKLDLPDQMLMSDGNDLWLFRKEAKEVLINDIDEGDDSVLSPIDLLKIYERDDFEYALVNEFKDKSNRTVQQIELKPNAKDADYSKIRIEINKADAAILGMMAFFKDGVRYKVVLDKETPNKSFSASTFAFDASQFPDVRVEDLRLD
ncbi:MAG: outer membrane lipoprotein carrier protein LolA [Saprospiraceae bacterium]|nr:outer membrane lipoprotein carrier protein LolA [Saprospiraceae bacterium]